MNALSHLPTTPTKDELRRRLRAACRAIPAGARWRDARRLVWHARRAAWLGDAEVVAAYWPLVGECDTRPLIAWMRGRGTSVLLPRVMGPGRMLFGRAPSQASALVEGPWGVMEPAGALGELGAARLILVPGCGFDRHGGRLGMGGGFYDRAIARRRLDPGPVLCVGVAWSSQVVEGRVPLEPHDERVDALLTPEGLIWCG